VPPVPHAPCVVILGVDTQIGLTLIRELGIHGVSVVALGTGPLAVGRLSRFTSHYYQRELTEKRLVGQLLALAKKHSATALVAISESDIAILNRYRTLLERVFHVLAPHADAMDKVLNKDRCLAIARGIGICTPLTLEIIDCESIDISELCFPVVMKWANPLAVAPLLESFGLPLHKAEYARDAQELHDKLIQYKPLGIYPLVQQYCPGYGLGQMFLIHEGKVLVEFQHERIHEYPPEGGISTICESISPNVHATCRSMSLALLHRLEWEGVAMVEYRFDPSSGIYSLMEVNGRFWGSQPLAFHCGAYFAWNWLAAHMQLPAMRDRPPLYGVRCCFLLPELYRQFRVMFMRYAITEHRYSRRASLLNLLRTLLSPRTRFYVFWVRDPMPAVADQLASAGRAICNAFGAFSSKRKRDAREANFEQLNR